MARGDAAMQKIVGEEEQLTPGSGDACVACELLRIGDSKEELRFGVVGNSEGEALRCGVGWQLVDARL
jgi:hypothetical protein